MIHNIKNKDVRKFLRFSSNPAKALNAVISVSFICFNVMWIILRIRDCFVLEIAFHSFILDIPLILLSIFLSLCLLLVIHRKKEIGIFFPRSIQYHIMKGFVCHIDRRAMEVAGRWEVSWEWRDFVSFAEISESGQEGEIR